MEISVRPYGRPGDFDLVGRFLIKYHLPANRDGNWLQPMWEYMHSHPGLNAAVLDHIGVWEDGGEIAGVVNYETDLGQAFFQLSPGHAGLKPEMLRYAEERLTGSPRDGGNKILRAYIFEHDHELAAVARSRGFRLEEGRGRPVARLEIRGPVAVPDLAGGFRLKSLADENDLRKIHRVMWRGFNHPGEPPEEGLAWRLQMQSGPNFKKDLNIIVEAPDGSFVSYAGLWYEPSNRIAYVEPVATDPDYRQMGLGRAAVLEGIRRCAARGATAAYVGSWQPFYLAIGFTKLFQHLCWIKQSGPGG